MASIELQVDINRVEGDLEFAITLEDGVVVEARTQGTLYRGFEQIMLGRDPQDALVITPRICGICGTAHLYAAVLALENAWQIEPPANARRIRNLCLMAEGLQNDLRQTFLFFTPDFCHARYADHPMANELRAAFTPMRGDIYRETLAITRQAVGIVAVFGGQWPHSSYMLPGGVTTPPSRRRISECLAILDEVESWYERRILGDSLANWLALDNHTALFAWLQTAGPAKAALGLMSHFSRDIGLHQQGRGTPHLLSFGAGCDPDGGEQRILPGGFFNGDSRQVETLDQQLINEHVRYSWFQPYLGGKHPWQGETIPDYLPGDDRYTWAKAPRYGDKVVQTGPIAELLLGGDALIADLYAQEGDNAWLRQFARTRRVAYELREARRTLQQLGEHLEAPHFTPPGPPPADGHGFGGVMAARGALGHWLEIREGKIARYQIVTPTAWNASPRDSNGTPGHWEQSLVGLKVADPDDPLEIGHIIRSHDPCLVCTVHMLGSGRRLTFTPSGKA